VLARAQLYQRVARFDESVPFSADWLMWLRAAAIAPVAVSAETLANYRLHEASMSSDFIKKNLYGVEVLRLSRILTEEWGGAAEPFPGAVREFDSTVSGQLLMDAMRRHQRGDRLGATAQAAGSSHRAVRDARLARIRGRKIDRVDGDPSARRVSETDQRPRAGRWKQDASVMDGD
jgi:hypothetical protein